MALDVISKISTSKVVKGLGDKTNKLCEKIGTTLEKSPKKDTFNKIIGKLEPTGANNPFITLAFLMSAMVIAPRIVAAARRNPDDKEGTKDEIKEILFRDVQTVAIVLFALKSINSVVAGKTTKITGLPMTNKPYNQVFNNKDKGLKGIIEKGKEFFENPKEKITNTGKNLLNMLHPTGGVRALTNDEFVAKYSGYNSIEEVQKLFNQIELEKGDSNKVFSKVIDNLINNQNKAIEYKKSQKLAGFDVDFKDSQEILNGLKKLKEKGLSGLSDKNLDEKVKNQIVDFFKKDDNELVMSAKRLNANLRTGALVFEAGYLGFGIPALNQLRLKNKYLNNKNPNQVQIQNNNINNTTNTINDSGLTLNNKNTSENELKIYQQFIK